MESRHDLFAPAEPWSNFGGLGQPEIWGLPHDISAFYCHGGDAAHRRLIEARLARNTP